MLFFYINVDEKYYIIFKLIIYVCVCVSDIFSEALKIY